MKYLLTILLSLALLLTSCTTPSRDFKTYYSLTQGDHFLYPNGWIQVEVQEHSPGVDVVFRDFLERTENVSVIISKIPESETLENLGSPSSVGYRFLKQINNSPNLKVKLELLKAELRETVTGNYYILEYLAQLPSGLQRHDEC
jgi:photosystem II oxygen-evolving enhancer protein 2